jgi:hypothetical protein
VADSITKTITGSPDSLHDRRIESAVGISKMIDARAQLFFQLYFRTHKLAARHLQ